MAKTVLAVIGVENVNMVARLMRGNRMVIAVGSHDDEHVGCVGLGEHVCQGLHCLIFVTHHIDDDIGPKPHTVVLERRREPLAVRPALAANRQFMLTVALLLRANALKRLDLTEMLHSSLACQRLIGNRMKPSGGKYNASGSRLPDLSKCRGLFKRGMPYALAPVRWGRSASTAYWKLRPQAKSWAAHVVNSPAVAKWRLG